MFIWIEKDSSQLMTKKSMKVKTKSAKKKDRPAKSDKKMGYFQNRYVYAGLVLVFLFSFYLRAIKPMSRIFVGDSILFDGNDPWYHMMLAKGTVLNLQRLWFDPLTNFPHGREITFGPFNSWGIAILSYIVDLGNPSMHTVEVVGAFFPAIIGALLVFPVYFIGREISGRAGGIMAAAMIAVLPGQFLSRSVIGFTDHHAAEVLLSTTAMLFFLLAIRAGQGKLSFATLSERKLVTLKGSLLYSVLAGLFLGLYLDAWSSGHLFVGVILIIITFQSVVDHLKGRNVEYLGITGSIVFAVSLLLILPFIRVENGFSTSLYSLFQPTMFILGIIFVLLLSLSSTYLAQRGMKKHYFPLLIVGVVIAGFLILSVATPQFIGPLTSGLHIFQPKTGGPSTISEAASIMERDGIQRNFPGLISLFSPFWLVLVFGLPLLVYRYWKEDRNTDLLILVWTVVILALTFAQNRFAYYYAVNVALLGGFLVSILLEKARFSEVEDAFIDMTKGKSRDDMDASRVLPTALVVFGLLLLFIYPSMFGTSEGMFIGSYHSEYQVGGPEKDWYESVLWLQDNTPDPGMELYTIYERPPKGENYPYPETAYGIMSWWDYGHWIETIGHRIPNANPFQQGIGNKATGAPGSSPFFLAQNESEAEAVLAKLDENRAAYSNTKYVITDFPMAVNKFHAIAAWSGEPLNKYYGAIPQGSSYTQVYMPTYFNTMVARLHFFDGTETPVSEAWAIRVSPSGQVEPIKVSRNYAELENIVNESEKQGYGAVIVTQSPASTAVPLEALKHYRLVYESKSAVTSNGQKYVKIFEHVPGAKIEGLAPVGTDVSISAPIRTNQGREFTYKQSTVSDSDGQFELVVPYSTEGPILGATNFATMPKGPYKLVVGETQYEVKVPEQTVLAGGSTRVSTTTA